MAACDSEITRDEETSRWIAVDESGWDGEQLPRRLSFASARVFRPEPAVRFLRAVPPLAYLSTLVFWFGIDEEPKSSTPRGPLNVFRHSLSVQPPVIR
jgi:hypothetical protein